MRFDLPIGFKKVPQRMNLLYAKYFARTYGYVGHVFQDRFKSWPIVDNLYLMECGLYIERNPLKAKIVSKPEDYEWSSYRFYSEDKTDNLVTPDPLYLDLGPSAETRRRHYAIYVNGTRPHEEAIEKVMFGKTVR
jgi:putative transposase